MRGLDRPPNGLIEEWVFQSLMTKVDTIGQLTFTEMLGYTPDIEIVFDNLDSSLSKKYTTILNKLRSRDVTNLTRYGYDKVAKEPFEEHLKITSIDPLKGIEGAPVQNAITLGKLKIAGKKSGEVLAADIIANELFRHLQQLPKNAPLNDQTALRGFRFEKWVWAEPEKSFDDAI